MSIENMNIPQQDFSNSAIISQGSKKHLNVKNRI